MARLGSQVNVAVAQAPIGASNPSAIKPQVYLQPLIALTRTRRH
jgi:hypothetical protein